ncbi:SCP-like protein [Ancylostoma ceylanicum]|uniref:SCP-like protein n=1 Tax=Ancylostoma ceylanicum TaxID=53326 RepID=A0A0D6LZL5_9BILA|nr:SCP-like protein [Ancylostoma ceylanicum]
MLAQGQVRNGKEGSPNCPKATNMYRMRYDMAMEKEAQLYADSCPDKGSDVSTRPYSGENTEIDPSTTISYLDAVVNMAWAATYKVGCGLNRCNYGTIVVCRYSPR